MTDVASPADPSGTLVGRFEILRVLGRGGMGDVYLARDLRDDAHVALKCLQRVDPAALLQIKQEFRLLADTLHPNLVRLFELFVEPDRTDGFRCYFSMEHVPGVALLEWLDPRRVGNSQLSTWVLDDLDRPPKVSAPQPVVPDTSQALNLERLGPVFLQLAGALAFLHGGGLLHRDVKSSNILVTAEGRVVLLDFGIAVGAQAGHRDERVIGTPEYMAPEQMEGGAAAGPSADWYSVGVLLYNAVCGHPPYAGAFSSMLRAKRQALPIDPARLALVPEGLRRLCLGLLEPDPSRRSGYRDITRELGSLEPAAAVPAATHAPLGREPERAVLRSAWQDVQAGTPRTVFIRGRSWIGKTCLLQSMLEEVGAESGTLVLAGRCHERELIPHNAFDGVVDALAGWLQATPAPEVALLVPRNAAALIRVFPVLEGLAGFPVAGRAEGLQDPRAERARAAVALEELLGNVARRWRLVVAVDDLQWGDADSATLLSRMMRSADPPNLLFVICFRSEDESDSPMLRELAPLRAEGDRTGRSRTISLGALEAQPARALFERSIGRWVAPDAAEALLQFAGGDPYLLTEAAAPPSAVASETGNALHDLLRARVLALPVAVRELLEGAAVAGRPFPLELLPRSNELDRRAGLRVGQHARLLRTTTPGGHERIDCYHDQVRAAVLAMLSDTRRRELHAALAHALERSPQPEPDAVSIHHEGAGDLVAAGRWALRAARAAAEALAFRQAAALYRRALSLAEPSEGRAAVEEQLGSCLANAGEGKQAADAFLRAADGVDGGTGLALRRRAVRELLLSGHVQPGIALLDPLLAEVGLGATPSSVGAAISALSGHVRLSLRGLEPAKLGVAEPALVERVDTLWTAAIGLHSIDPIRAAAFVSHQLLHALDLGDPGRIAAGLAGRAAAAAVRGTAGQGTALSLIARAKSMAEIAGDRQVTGLVAMELGMVHFMTGRMRAADAAFREAEAIFSQGCPQAVWERATTELFHLDVRGWLGDLDAVATRTDTLVRDGTAADNLYQLTAMIRPMHQVHLRADDPARARADIDHAMDRWPGAGFIQHYNATWSRTQIDLYEGDALGAYARVRAFRGQLWRSMLVTFEYVNVEYRHLRARAALAAGDIDSAARDAAWLVRMGAPWANALGLLVHAGVLAARGRDRAEVEGGLLAAHERLEAEGLELYVAAVRWRIGEVRGGAAGERTRAEAERDLVGRGVRRPASLVAMKAPGFGHDTRRRAPTRRPGPA